MKILLACVLCGYKSLWFLSGWCRSDGQESHRGHVRWLGGPRGRSFLWKGLHQGGPLGRLRCTLGGKISGEGPAVQAGTGAGETSFQFHLLQKVSEMCAGWKGSEVCFLSHFMQIILLDFCGTQLLCLSLLCGSKLLLVRGNNQKA